MSHDQLTVRITINKETPLPSTASSLVSRWHKKRIALFLLMSGLLVFAIYRFYFQNSPVNETVLPPAFTEHQAPAGAAVSPLPVVPEAPKKVASLPAEKKAALPALPNGTALATRQNTHKTRQVSSSVIKRVVLSRDIQHNEPRLPLQNLISLSKLSDNSLYLFSEINGLSGQGIHHRWFYKNQLMMDISHTLGAERWRCFSRKSFNKKLLGQWRVDITDQHGKLLHQQSFKLQP